MNRLRPLFVLLIAATPFLLHTHHTKPSAAVIARCTDSLSGGSIDDELTVVRLQAQFRFCVHQAHSTFTHAQEETAVDRALLRSVRP